MTAILETLTLSDTAREVKDIDKTEVRRENYLVIWRNKETLRKQWLKGKSM